MEPAYEPALHPVDPGESIDAMGSPRLDPRDESLELTLRVRDPEVIEELASFGSARERDHYALAALRLGVLSLRTARGQVDTHAVRGEVERMLHTLEKHLVQHRDTLQLSLGSSLREYFDPKSGRFAERVEALVRDDGELSRVIRGQVEGSDSALAKTLGAHLGPESPMMRSLDPDHSEGLLPRVEGMMSEALHGQRERILREFSLDNREGALTRLVGELGSHHGKLTEALEQRIDEVVREFSLDDSDSALSRLVHRVERAQQQITDEFTLDSDTSALARMRRELTGIAEKQSEKISALEQRVAAEMAALTAKRKAEAKSTTHGRHFENALLEHLRASVQGAGDLFSETGTRPGLIRNCKVGDAVLELSANHHAAGARIVIEAKEKAGYNAAQAQTELDTGRQNRDAEFGILVLSARCAPEEQARFYPLGQGVLVVWDADDPASDVYLEAALALARASCIRARSRSGEGFDLGALDKAVRHVEKQIEGLEEIRTAAETIERGSARILKRARILDDNLCRAVRDLDRCSDAAKVCLG